MLSIQAESLRGARSPSAKPWRSGQPFLSTASAPAVLGRPIGSNYSIAITEITMDWIRERRRRDKTAVAKRKKVVNPDTGETPAGYNKMLRDGARIALACSSAALLGGWPQIALVASAIAAGLLQQGTTQRPSSSNYSDDIASMRGGK